MSSLKLDLHSDRPRVVVAPQHRKSQTDVGFRSRPWSFNGVAKSILVRSGIVTIAREWPRAACSATILRYHSVSAASDYCSPTIAVSPELFEKQMEYLSRHYKVFSLDDLVLGFESRDLPHKSVAITFDDGYADNATAALPVLARYKLPATFFVTSDSVLGKGAFWVGWLYRAVWRAPAMALQKACSLILGTDGIAGRRNNVFAALASRIDKADTADRSTYLSSLESAFTHMPPLCEPSDFMMSIEQLHELHAAGMIIGAHTSTHRVLAGIPESEAREELTRSKGDLEAELGQSVRHLAYPNGHVERNVDANAIRLAQEAGYWSAGTSRRGIVTERSSIHDLSRQGINEALGLDGFVFKLEEARFPFLLQHGA